LGGHFLERVKMESIRIETGEKRIAILRDDVNVGEIVFNPSDVLFAEKFYKLVGDLRNDMQAYKQRADALDEEEPPGDTIPKNFDERMALIKETSDYMRGKIDAIFGKGTSQMAFGDTLVLDAYLQFLDGLTPHIKNARTKKIARYANPVAEKKNRHAKK
jgi:hypothetical protein